MDRRGATDENCLRIHAIDAWEALGYRGSGHEEHSGEPRVPLAVTFADELADNSPEQIAVTPERVDRDLHQATRPFAKQSAAQSWWYLSSTFVLLGGVLTGAALAPWWPLRLAASILGAMLLLRTFILYHDFMHGSILPGSKLARAIFYTYGAINLTPPRSWRDSHNFHHANVGRIDGSDVGSFALMTTDSWRKSSRMEKFAYRVTRHPVTILFAYLTVFMLTVTLRPLLRRPSRYWDSALSLLAHGSLIALLLVFGGFDTAFFALVLPMAIAAAVGGYLFYAQHSFPGMQILPEDEWTMERASLVSSSCLSAGPVLHWFTGNIGFHHVHHLNSLIPFYRLPDAMAEIPELQHPGVTSLRPRDIVACFRANLWDVQKGRMVRYGEAQ